VLKKFVAILAILKVRKELILFRFLESGFELIAAGLGLVKVLVGGVFLGLPLFFGFRLVVQSQ